MTTRDKADTHKAHCPIEAEVDATFAEWMGDGDVYWNAERNAWIVTGYAETAKILADASTFWRDIPQREGSPEFWGRHLLVLEGRDHRRLHSLHMKLTGEAFAENIREKARELCRGVISPAREKGPGRTRRGLRRHCHFPDRLRFCRL